MQQQPIDMYAGQMSDPLGRMFNPFLSQESQINNIVAQIDPKNIIDNLDHALKGEQWNKEAQQWELTEGGEELCNSACRGAVISYLDGILTNNTTMAYLDEKRVSFLMESVIDTIQRMFVVNLEKFGFVPKGEYYNMGIYYNKGTPDTARMTLIANMVFKVAFLVFSRAIKGAESSRIFKSLNISDVNNPNAAQPAKKGFFSGLFGG